MSCREHANWMDIYSWQFEAVFQTLCQGQNFVGIYYSRQTLWLKFKFWLNFFRVVTSAFLKKNEKKSNLLLGIRNSSNIQLSLDLE